MITYALRRLIYSIPVVIIASFLLFWAVRRAFDPLSELRQSQDPEALARETERLGLDQPIPSSTSTGSQDSSPATGESAPGPDAKSPT